MSVTTARPGLVIFYVNLWAREHPRGAEDSTKHRACVIVAVRQVIDWRDVVTVVPPPTDPAGAIEVPSALKVVSMISHRGSSSPKPMTSYGGDRITGRGQA